MVGLSMLDAADKLASAGLRIKVVGSGIAAQQLPSAGTVVPKGSLVEVQFKL